MSFENKPTDTLIRIAKAGLGFTLNKNNISAEDLHRIITAATQGGAHITIVNMQKSRSKELPLSFSNSPTCHFKLSP
jgi:hypothetical protein